MAPNSQNFSAILVHSPHLFVSEFERNFHPFQHVESVLNPWIPILALVIYLAFVYKGKQWMKSSNNGPKIAALLIKRRNLIAWNSALCIVGVCGVIRLVPLLYQLLRYGSYEESVCGANSEHYSEIFNIPGIWIYVLLYCKVLELADTAILVLSKKPLTFLHVYYHVTVLLFLWYQAVTSTLCGAFVWYLACNYFTQFLTHGYFALDVIGYDFSFVAKMMVSLTQLSEISLSFLITFSAFCYRSLHRPCAMSSTAVSLSFAVYMSYFALSFNFFCMCYAVPVMQTGWEPLKRPKKRK